MEKKYYDYYFKKVQKIESEEKLNEMLNKVHDLEELSLSEKM